MIDTTDLVTIDDSGEDPSDLDGYCHNCGRFVEVIVQEDDREYYSCGRCGATWLVEALGGGSRHDNWL